MAARARLCTSAILALLFTLVCGSYQHHPGRVSPHHSYATPVHHYHPSYPIHRTHRLYQGRSNSNKVLYASSQGGYSDSRDLDDYKLNDVIIEVPSMNSRKITASTIVEAPVGNIWSIITDYNNLSDHVPNLVKSYVVPGPSQAAGNKGMNQYNVRLFQEGAQKIIGFDFRASLMMDMTEEYTGDSNKERRLSFKLVDSTMFASFDGSWSMRSHSCYKALDPISRQTVIRERSLLTYTVYVKPKGIVPVLALEWRIKEDIPINLHAVKVAAEMHKPPLIRQQSNINAFSVGGLAVGASAVDWQTDETLASYMSATRAPDK